MREIKEQNLLWECLPDEVKDKILEIYEDSIDLMLGTDFTDDGYEAETKVLSLEKAFGKHNLFYYKTYFKKLNGKDNTAGN